eukprot:CAMPEP_0197022690 /NCGR_PEP_ID=MMETSP1384-20130603/3503_1 /TAXON_ID=29189 /ORGANISM="Ammonia sp." /LENGTH=191 /DNA_ID=CAMNT_0042450775 /DNA_START=150 /DNA_END=726 /DNA_ORIENTATION=+
MFIFLFMLVLTCTNMVHSEETAVNADNDSELADNAQIEPTSSTTTTTTTTTTTSTSSSTFYTKQQGEDESTSTSTTAAVQGSLDIVDNNDGENEDDTPIISESEADEMTGGGVWSSIGMIAVVICGCICLERLYSSCKKVYQKRTGRYGFSRLQNQTFNEYGEDEEDDDDLDENLGHNITTNNKDSDQESV